MFGGSMVDLSLTSLIMHISYSGVTKRVTVLIFGTQGAVLDQNISPLCHVASMTLTPIYHMNAIIPTICLESRFCCFAAKSHMC